MHKIANPLPLLLARLRKVRLLCLDVDGTMTDGRIIISLREEAKEFDVQDGTGISLLLAAGIHVAIITGRKSSIVEIRAKELGIKYVFQGVGDKETVVRDLARQLEIAPESIASMGDDLPDLKMFLASGIRLAPANAVPEVQAIADWVSSRSGGDGAVREAAELILKAQERWASTVLSRYACSIDELGSEMP